MRWAHADFQNAYEEAQVWQEYCGDQIRNRFGLDVYVTPKQIAKTVFEAPEYKQQQDILVEGLLVEVKGRREAFDSVESFPFGDPYTERVNRWNEKNEKPICYVLISKPTGFMMWLDTERSFPSWYVIEDAYHSVHDAYYTTYACPLSFFKPLDGSFRSFIERSI